MRHDVICWIRSVPWNTHGMGHTMILFRNMIIVRWFVYCCPKISDIGELSKPLKRRSVGWVSVIVSKVDTRSKPSVIDTNFKDIQRQFRLVTFLFPVSSATLDSVMVGRVGTGCTPGILGTVGTRAKASKFNEECTPGSMFRGALKRRTISV